MVGVLTPVLCRTEGSDGRAALSAPPKITDYSPLLAKAGDHPSNYPLDSMVICTTLQVLCSCLTPMMSHTGE